jgi:hypothetical protein
MTGRNDMLPSLKCEVPALSRLALGVQLSAFPKIRVRPCSSVVNPLRGYEFGHLKGLLNANQQAACGRCSLRTIGVTLRLCE